MSKKTNSASHAGQSVEDARYRIGEQPHMLGKTVPGDQSKETWGLNFSQLAKVLVVVVPNGSRKAGLSVRCTETADISTVAVMRALVCFPLFLGLFAANCYLATSRPTNRPIGHCYRRMPQVHAKTQLGSQNWPVGYTSVNLLPTHAHRLSQVNWGISLITFSLRSSFQVA